MSYRLHYPPQQTYRLRSTQDSGSPATNLHNYNDASVVVNDGSAVTPGRQPSNSVGATQYFMSDESAIDEVASGRPAIAQLWRAADYVESQHHTTTTIMPQHRLVRIVDTPMEEEEGDEEYAEEGVYYSVGPLGHTGRRIPRRPPKPDPYSPSLPFRCEVPECGKRFAMKKYLQRHQKIHEAADAKSERFRYECTFCQEVFTSRHNLARHRRYHFRQQQPPEIRQRTPPRMKQRQEQQLLSLLTDETESEGPAKAGFLQASASQTRPLAVPSSTCTSLVHVQQKEPEKQPITTTTATHSAANVENEEEQDRPPSLEPETQLNIDELEEEEPNVEESLTPPVDVAGTSTTTTAAYNVYINDEGEEIYEPVVPLDDFGEEEELYYGGEEFDDEHDQLVNAHAEYYEPRAQGGIIRPEWRNASLDVANTRLRRHRKPPDSSKVFACTEPQCLKRFSSLKYLQRHQKRHSDEFDPRKYTCSFEGCSQKFSSREKLARHRRTHFLPDRACVCDKCPARYMREADLRHHKMKTHPEEEEESDKGTSESTEAESYKCRFGDCSHSYRHRRDLLRHMRTNHSHTTNNPFMRLEDVNTVGRYACHWPDCRQKFTLKKDLASHRRVHFLETPFVCLMCWSRFGQRGDLESHMKSEHP